MSKDWVLADEVLSAASGAFEGDPEKDLLMLARYGSVLTRAGKATLLHGGKITSKLDWEIPPDIWSATDDGWGPLGLSKNSSKVDFATNSAIIEGVDCEAVGIAPEALLDSREVNLYLYEVCFLRRDLAGFGLAEDLPSKDDAPPVRRRGPAPDVERLIDFGAGLTAVIHENGLSTYTSRSAVYDAVASFLAERGLTAIDEKKVRAMIDKARRWGGS